MRWSQAPAGPCRWYKPPANAPSNARSAAGGRLRTQGELRQRTEPASRVPRLRRLQACSSLESPRQRTFGVPASAGAVSSPGCHSPAPLAGPCRPVASLPLPWPTPSCAARFPRGIRRGLVTTTRGIRRGLVTTTRGIRRGLVTTTRGMQQQSAACNGRLQILSHIHCPLAPGAALCGWISLCYGNNIFRGRMSDHAQ
jgi:hypothetical protein